MVFTPYRGSLKKNIFQVDNQIFPAIQSMKDTYNYILIDTPPIGTLSDVQLMRGLMDSVVLVVRPGWVLRSAVEESLAFLKKSGIPLTGGIVNGKIKRVPLEECAGKLKMVSPKDQTVKAAKQIGISFGD